MNEIPVANPQPSALDNPTPSPVTPPQKSNAKWFIIGGVALALAICFCIALCVATIGFGGYSVWKEKTPIGEVVDAFMRAMEQEDTEKAFALFSTRAQRQMRKSDLEKMIQGNNYVLFEGYQSVTIENINISKSINTNQNLPQGTVATINGTVIYEDGVTGRFDAVLEKEGDSWRLHKINITVPPDKLKP